MGLLKKIGIEILKIAGIVAGILPVAETLAPQTAPVLHTLGTDLSKFFSIVQDVEVAAAALSTPAAGPEKLKMATPLIAQEILKVIDTLGLKVSNPNAFIAAATGYASVTADLANALEKK